MVPVLYENGDFDEATITNELILRIGYANVAEEDVKEINDNGLPTSQVSSKKVEENIKYIFGDIEYENGDFTLVNENSVYLYNYGFFGSNKKFGTEATFNEVEYNNGNYLYHCVEGSGCWRPFIDQQLFRSEQDDDIIKLYVKCYYVNIETNPKSDDYDYPAAWQTNPNFAIYKNYSDNKFKGKLTTLDSESYFSEEPNHKAVTSKPMNFTKDYLLNMNTYCYTFKKSSDGEYYLTEFHADPQLAKANERKENLDNMKATENTQKAVIFREQQTTKETTTTTTTTTLDENEIYQKIIDKYEKQFIKYYEQEGTREQYSYNNLYRCGYTEYDIDKNGINELIIEDYTCEADRCFHFYTIKNNKAINIGKFDEAVHTGLYDNNGTLMSVEGTCGLFTAYSFFIKNDEINYTKVLSQSNIQPDYCTSDNGLDFVWFVY